MFNLIPSYNVLFLYLTHSMSTHSMRDEPSFFRIRRPTPNIKALVTS
jgi:hypothetical protein